MKYILLAISILVFGFVSAQNDEVYYFQQQLKMKFQKKSINLPQYQSPVSMLTQKDVTYFLPDGNKIITLRQDKMPCVVPDMSQFNMPNAGSKTMLYPRKGAIPNSVLEQRCW